MDRLKRLASSLRGLHYGAFLFEMSLLVAGILIALAVNGWIEGRRDVRTERQYFERLASDLAQDLVTLNEYVEFERRQTDDAVVAHRAFCAGLPVADREAATAALDHLTTRRTVRFARATYSDLLATGNLRLIRDTALRDRIVGLYEANDRWAAILDRNNQVYVDQMYLGFLADEGLIRPRGSNNLPAVVASREAFARRLGQPATASTERVWTLGVDSRELSALCTKLAYRGLVSAQGIDQARGTGRQISALRREIASAMENR